eukprot:15456416-Alexandrium_andersonii.AAC.1
MRNALKVPGLLHIVTNLLNDVHHNFRNWERFQEQCRELAKLLCLHPRKMRFVQQCLVGSSWASLQYAFERTFPPLYEKRWHVVLSFTKKVLRVWPALKAT